MKMVNNALLDRVVSILEEARLNVVRSVNNNMVIAYWLIGREIVQAVQGGEERAKYGQQIIGQLAVGLVQKYGRGFSITNLRYFRTFYSVYSDRIPEIRHIGCGEFNKMAITQKDVLNDIAKTIEVNQAKMGFSPELGWSHYRALMKVENKNERFFYEIEAEKEQWDVEYLERQIHTFLFARLLKSKDKAGIIELTRKGNILSQPADTIKNPYILDFLGLPDISGFHESELESAIIYHLQDFLLEMGKGFAFVARQKRMQFDDQLLYIDLVFYNCILKCYILIDLKIGKLTHRDVGQIDGYVRMFDELYTEEDDNPTIGLILCSEKNEQVARYSVLKDSQRLFASRYMLYLPTEKELQQEIERERHLIEGQFAKNAATALRKQDRKVIVKKYKEPVK